MTHEFVADEQGGVSVVVAGHPQSYVSVADPGLLAFEYVQHLGAIIDVLEPGPLAVSHVGGAGLTLPRYVQFTRPGSPQIVLEPDEALTARVRQELPLPRGHRIRVRGQDGRAGVAGLKDGSAQVVVLDAFTAEGSVPPELTTTPALRDVARVLAPGGVWLANLPDEPGLRFVARVCASAAAAGLGHQVLVATHEVLKGRRFGNVVLVAGTDPLPEAAIRRRVARSPFPTGVRSDGEVARMRRTARELLDGEPGASPQAPDPGRWRVR